MYYSECEEATVAINSSTLHDSVVEFLLNAGNNPRLASELSENSRYNFGPVNYSIVGLVNPVGPGKKYHEEQSSYDSRVESMINSIKNGWKPAPLIVTNIWNDSFEIADGCHRQTAFKKLGINSYPIIFYFRDQTSLDDFVQKYIKSN